MKAFLESANAPVTTLIKVTILSQGRVFCEIPDGASGSRDRDRGRRRGGGPAETRALSFIDSHSLCCRVPVVGLGVHCAIGAVGGGPQANL
jgi:hypothetical protein